LNWRTGEITQTDAIPPGFPGVFGGRAEVTAPEGASVVDAARGETLLHQATEAVPFDNGDRLRMKEGEVFRSDEGEVFRLEEGQLNGYTIGGLAEFTLSPDGRYAMLSAESDGDTFDVYQVDSGDHVSIDGSTYDYGWSPDGTLFRIEGRKLTTCLPTSGECETSRLDIERGPGELKLGGRVYES
jgi:hypothetical protein